MAYPQYSPYQQNFNSPAFTGYQQYPQYYQQMQNQQAAPQIQNSGFISAKSIEEAFNWPLAPGNSLTFKIENAPYICTKTKGFSQLDQPIFEKYRLVKEDDAPAFREQEKETDKIDLSAYALKTDYDALKEEVQAIKAQIAETAQRKPGRAKKEEADE